MFYSQIIIYGSFCIAYDCGSIKNKNINNYIKTCHINFIDALFISHLDNDHCNGLEILFNRYDIKHIFLPLMSSNEKALCLSKLLSHYNNWREEDTQTIELILEPKKIIDNYSKGKCKVHFVKQFVDTNNKNNDYEYSKNNIFIDDINENIESGKSIKFIQTSNNSIFIDWYFITWNFEFKNRQDKLIKSMESIPLIQLYINNNKEIDIESLKSDLKTNKRDILIKLLKYCYNMCGGTNDNSMVLFSGFLKNNIILNINLFGYEYCDFNASCRKDKNRIKGCHNNCCSHIISKITNKNSNILPSCLYLGDINVKRLLKDFWNNNPFKILSSFIGLYQQPHHGANSSFHKSLINNCSPRLTFINYGIINGFNHPRHCLDIKNKNIKTFHVTEKYNFVEIINII